MIIKPKRRNLKSDKEIIKKRLKIQRKFLGITEEHKNLYLDNLDPNYDKLIQRLEYIKNKVPQEAYIKIKKYLNFYNNIESDIDYKITLLELFDNYFKDFDYDLIKFHKFIKELQKKGIIGPVAIGNYVKLNNDINIFRVINVNKKGYELFDELNKKIIVKKYKDIKKYFANSWYDVNFLHKNKIFVMHSLTLNKDINLDIFSLSDIVESLKWMLNEKNKKTALSGFTFSNKYKPSVFNFKNKPYNLGIILNQGKIYTAYDRDAHTRARIHQNYKISRDQFFSLPVEKAIVGNTKYNEVLVQNWKAGGLFFTPKTPLHIKIFLISFAKLQHLEIYEINPKSKKIKQYN